MQFPLITFHLTGHLVSQGIFNYIHVVAVMLVLPHRSVIAKSIVKAS